MSLPSELAVIVDRPQVDKEARYEPVRCYETHENEHRQRKHTYADSRPHSALEARVAKEAGNATASTVVVVRSMAYKWRHGLAVEFKIFGLTYDNEKISVIQAYKNQVHNSHRSTYRISWFNSARSLGD